ncbi:MAG: S-layer homology domain-containing protein [Lawsonibacter sp.]|nr:S-layer homology domain-containing protein [Lawsonibacter sp.]
MRNAKTRSLSLLLVLILVFGMLPGTAWAGGESGDVTISVAFDYRSVATAEVLNAYDLEVPTNQTVTVPSGSKVYAVLEAARGAGGFGITYGSGWDGSANGYVSAIGDIGDIQTLCAGLGVSYNQLFQYAGWVYSGDNVDEMGIQSDTVTQDATITFSYQVYSGSGTGGTWTNFDGPFVQAYYGLKDNLEQAKNLQEASFTGPEWTALQAAISNGDTAVSAIENGNGGTYLTSGLMLGYLAEKGSAIWGDETSTTGKLEKAGRILDRAVDREVSPVSIQVPAGVKIPLNSLYSLAPKVLPEDASQQVTYQVLLGGDDFSISDSGVITPLATDSACIIRVTSAEEPTVAATFLFQIVASTPISADASALLTNISNGYVNSSGDWAVMDIGAYALVCAGGATLSDSAKQTYVNQAILTAATDNEGIANYAKVILGLSAIGVDPTNLTLVNGTTVNAVDRMKAASWDASDPYFIYSAPYVLLAYQQGDWNSDSQEQALIEYILGLQKEDGSWDTSWGFDTMGMAMQGLAAYYNENAQVKQALDKAADYLREHVRNDGMFPNSYDEAFSAAEVALGLCAMGVDPDEVKNAASGASVLDGILLKANAGNTAFTFNGSDSTGTTERCFRALIAMSKLQAGADQYNVYDFTSVPKTGASIYWDGCPVSFTVIPSTAALTVQMDSTIISAKTGTMYDLPSGTYTYTVVKAGYTTKTGVVDVSSDDGTNHTLKQIPISLVSAPSNGGGSGSKTVDVTVKVMVPPENTSQVYTYKSNKSLYSNLINEVSMPLSLESGSTARDVLIQSLDDQGLSYVEKSDGYFSTIDGWEELARGSASGWMYMVNGSVPDEAANQYQVTSNSVVTWFYTDNYAKDHGAETWSSGSSAIKTSDAKVTKTKNGTYSVTLPANSSGPVLVILPDAKAGQVAVIVHADGTQEVVRKSLIQDGSAYLMLEADATVKLVDYVSRFRDVDSGAWYASAVDFVASRGLFSGVSESTFAPEATLNRGTLVTVLYALEQPGTQTVEKLFSDVNTDAWYAQSTAWAVEAGVVSGYENGQFGPEDPVTREQLALMLYQYANRLNAGTSGRSSLARFQDSSDVSSWAEEAVSWAVDAGILNGRTGGTLDPSGPATRAEMAAMLHQFVAFIL